jgi:hypothetical protein
MAEMGREFFPRKISSGAGCDTSVVSLQGQLLRLFKQTAFAYRELAWNL